jgi:hypothetical protein
MSRNDGRLDGDWDCWLSRAKVENTLTLALHPRALMPGAWLSAAIGSRPKHEGLIGWRLFGLGSRNDLAAASATQIVEDARRSVRAGGGFA